MGIGYTYWQIYFIISFPTLKNYLISVSSFENRLNNKGDCFQFFKMSLSSTPNHIEDNEIEILVIGKISTLKRSSKRCGRNEVFDLVQISLDTDITRVIFDELLQNMGESKAVKLRTVGDRERRKIKEAQTKKKTLIVRDSIVKNFEGWKLNKRMKSVAVKEIPGATTKGMKHQIKECLEDIDSIILHVGTNNHKNKESAKHIANDIMDVAIFIRNKKPMYLCLVDLSEMIG